MTSRLGEVLRAFAVLGVTSFGGPIAHLGYFRETFVARRGWLRDDEYADLVALCHVLPGPTSSQVGFAIGLRRAGVLGALAAFVAFTMPSAIIMVAAAAGASLVGGAIGSGLVRGLEIVAVAVVAHAVWGMSRTLTPDRRRIGIALGAGVLVLVAPVWGAPVAAIVLGAVAGGVLCREVAPLASGPVAPVSRAAGLASLAVFAAILVAAPLLAHTTGDGAARLFDAFFRAGSLVFGGGHVVLPLLSSSVVGGGWVSPEQFLAGYGVAQAVPGPLFTFAGYLGALSEVGPGGVAGAAIALVAIFLPGFLLLVGVLPFWSALHARRGTAAVVAGAGAAVVGILGAALYSPLATTALTSPGAVALAAICLALLAAFRVPPWIVVLVGAAGGVLLAVTGV